MLRPACLLTRLSRALSPDPIVGLVTLSTVWVANGALPIPRAGLTPATRRPLLGGPPHRTLKPPPPFFTIPPRRKGRPQPPGGPPPPPDRAAGLPARPAAPPRVR